MEAKRAEFISGFIGIAFVFSLALLFLTGCSTPAASKPQGATTPQADVATQKKATATPSKPPPTSSLEAHQKGILGKEGAVGPLRDVTFDFDRYDIRPDAREILKQNAAWLKANPQTRIEIEGHCDERGTNEYNLALGAKRADSVKRYFIDLGIRPDRLSTVSYGEELPLCKEQSEACWARNRRAHFAIKTAPTG